MAEILDIIKSWWTQIIFVSSAVVFAGGFVARKMSDIQKKDDAVRVGLLELLRVRLYKECKKCIMVGAKTEDLIETLVGLHTAYNGLGGNHTGDILFNEAMSKPTVSEEIFNNIYRKINCIHVDLD